MVDRCEPPEALRGVDGWHWIDRPSKGETMVAEWSYLDQHWLDWWINADPALAHQRGWRYLAPVPAPADVAALCEAAETAMWCLEDSIYEAGSFNPMKVVTALRAALARVEGETE